MVFRKERAVFFPWEERRGLLGAISRTRMGQVLLAAALLSLVGFLVRREEGASRVRATRATLFVVRRAIAAYQADQKGACPPSLDAVVHGGYLKVAPLDAWGHRLRLVCPGREDSFDLMSDGPDGLAGGLDRVE